MILTTTIRLITSLLALSALSTTSCQKEENAVRWEPDSSIEAKVTALLSEMTIDEKIGQMTQADRGALGNIQDIKEFHLGSLLSGGGSAPSDNSPAGWADMYDRFQSYALQTRLKIPLIYGIDAVHGHNNVRGAVIFPHNIGLGCTNNPAIVEEVERVTAKEVAGTGIDWTFAPCIAVPRDERWGRTYEGFSESPDPTKLMTAAAVKGFQGSSLGDGGSILACAKHFLGDGGTTDGRDQGNTQVDEQTMRALHLPGYIAAINAGVGSIMVSYSSWNGVKMHGSSYWITDVLKGELAFKGFVVSDWAGIDQLPGDYASDVAMAINAGIDMVMVPTKYKEFITTLRTLVNQGRVPLLRIDDAVRRILRKKFELGIFDRPLTDRTLTLSIGSRGSAAIRRTVEEREQNSSPLQEYFPYSRCGKECGRSREPVRRMDHQLVGKQRADYNGYDIPSSSEKLCLACHKGDLFSRRHGGDGRRDRYRRCRRNTLRRGARRSMGPQPVSRGRSVCRSFESHRHPGCDHPDLRQAHDHRNGARNFGRLHRGVAAGDGRARRRGCGSRRLQPDGKALTLVAPDNVTNSDQCRRPELYPAFPIWIWIELRKVNP